MKRALLTGLVAAAIFIGLGFLVESAGVQNWIAPRIGIGIGVGLIVAALSLVISKKRH